MVALTTLSALAALLCTVGALNTSLPIVDLGYELHQGSYEAEGRYYNFSNIRYAAPPVGELRFAKPQPPAVNRSVVQTGDQGRICAQASPSWATASGQWLGAYLANGTTNFSSSLFESKGPFQAPPQDPMTSEDCLFLDVMAPQSIFDNAGKSAGAPVLVWIYGGGYIGGSKISEGSPSGLLKRSNNGVVYVALNYRLGAFGWLSGSTLQANGTANAGLHDQRLALKWVQDNIHLFGGDPNQVTVFGESAGGGSIMHHITAYGGKQGPAPFARAIAQSPAWFPMVSSVSQENIFNDFLHYANVSTIEQARKLPFEALQRANLQQVANSYIGGVTYGPVVDGDYAPALPGQLLARGHFDKSVKVMAGHNGDEGIIFTDPLVKDEATFEDFILTALPSLSSYPKALDHITKVLYPPIFDGSQAQGYRTQVARAAALIGEIGFTCNTFYLNKGFSNNTHAYMFAAPPALHAMDVEYTYYCGNSSGTPGSSVSTPGQANLAYGLQTYITNFAQYGNPNGNGSSTSTPVPYFPVYGNNATIQVLNVTDFHTMRDTEANPRCAWWQKGLYF
ncbi:hypothetical protein AAFC00_006582 [Neodothiora populina]|uniref:Carboxylic ester hydrolase n=1 Tax=Neodothiora populina TaxID=2781224 RepID=A0ABR3PAF7_9PEZI